ncbi:MAG: NUDIX hydrolase [Desulfurococcaceae archaeon]
MQSRAYPSYAIAAVGAVLLKENSVLLVKRKYPPGVGKWSIPGGVVEPGERIAEAARRELKEETGLEAEPVGILWVLNNIVYDRERRVLYHYVILDVLFDSSSIRGELKPGGDVEDAAWMSIPEIQQRPDVSRTVKKLTERLTRGSTCVIPLEGVDLETTQH